MGYRSLRCSRRLYAPLFKLAALAPVLLLAGCSLLSPKTSPLPGWVDEINALPTEQLNKQQVILLLDWSRSGCLRLADAFAHLGETAAAADLLPECRRRAARENLKALRARLLEFYPEWGDEVRKRIGEGRPFVGMTAEQLVACLGEPREKNKKAAGQELWVYVPGKVSVTVKNGKVSSIQSPGK